MNMKNEIIGNRVKAIRKERGLTQDEFAKSLGYSDKSVISHIEKGDADMTYEKILLLLRTYMLDANELFDTREIDTLIENNRKEKEKNNQHSRTEMLIGKDGLKKLHSSKVILFGVGGVGGSVFEALVRSNVGEITVVDNDVFDVSNLNRQALATYSNIGKAKVSEAVKRGREINRDVRVIPVKLFYLPETKDQFDFSKYDYVIDCVDTVSAKLSIIEEAKKVGVKVISAMGAGNKLHPELLEVSDISKTEVDPLAKVMRRELRNRGINHLKVVYSKEPPIQNKPSKGRNEKGRAIPGSMALVPSTMGLLLTSEVINDLLQDKQNN